MSKCGARDWREFVALPTSSFLRGFGRMFSEINAPVIVIVIVIPDAPNVFTQPSSIPPPHTHTLTTTAAATLPAAFGLTLALSSTLVICAGVIARLRGRRDTNNGGWRLDFDGAIGGGGRSRVLGRSAVANLPTVTVLPGDEHEGAICSVCQYILELRNLVKFYTPCKKT